MFTYLFNKLPAVRRLRAALEREELCHVGCGAIANANTRESLANVRVMHPDYLSASVQDCIRAVEREIQMREAFDKSDRALRITRDELDYVKGKRKELHRQVDEMKATTVMQAATIDVLRGERETDLRLLNERALAAAEAKGREERWVHTIDVINETLRNRNGELADARAELADAQAVIERQTRPVLFKRDGGFTDDEIEEILAGKGRERVVQAMLQVLDECAVQAMSEAAQAPAVTITDGPHANRGFTAEERGFSSGGVFALTRLKQVIEDKLAPREEERKAA